MTDAVPTNLYSVLETLQQQLIQAPHKALQHFKQAKRQGEQYLEQQFDTGESIDVLVTQRVALVDALLQQLWQHFALNLHPLALIAVGGYGRQELHPCSDIDVLILVEDLDDDHVKEPLEQFITFLWDLKFDVGHSIRTLQDCADQARLDLSTATNMMEARFLIGNVELYTQLEALINKASTWSTADFFQAKRSEQIARHRKYDDTAYNLEPNLKESPGGLRDIQMIGWVSKRHFSASNIHDLVDKGFLTEMEYSSLMEKQHFLWKIRWALHFQAKRKEERLLFDYQSAIAERLGYIEQPGKLAVEQMMQQFYRAMMKISSLNEILLQFFEEAILQKNQEQHICIIDNWFQVRNHYIEVRHNQVFLQRPAAMLELFLHMANYPEIEGIRASTIRLLRPHRHLIDDRFRKDPLHKRIFMALMSHPNGPGRPLQLMKRHGILRYYLPVFGNIIGQMQFDLFHAYTVDEHTFILLKNLYRFSQQVHNDEFPLCSKIMQNLHKTDLIYLAGLFHDIAKGRGGDHSELGATDAWEFCQAHGLSYEDSHLVSWLVRNHLVMSMTAQRMDISDPEVIHRFAKQVKDQNYLDHLYILTVADIRATNQKQWNSWKNALLKELYLATRQVLRRGLDKALAKDDQATETRLEAARLLQEQHIPVHAIEGLWSHLDEQYFLKYSAEQIVWHAREIIQHWGHATPLVKINPNNDEAGTELFLYSHDQPNQFAIITTILDQSNISVAEATISTTNDHYSLDTFILLDDLGTPIRNLDNQSILLQRIDQGLQNPDSIQTRATRPPSRIVKQFTVETQVEFKESNNPKRTRLDITCLDRPGLLASISGAFRECHIKIHDAKIVTLGERAEDTFYITDTRDEPITDQAFQQRMIEIILKHLKQDINR